MSDHINNIYADGEFHPAATVRKIRTVQKEGGREVARELDSILSSTARKLLTTAGSSSHSQAEEKAKLEYRKYKAKTLEKEGRIFEPRMNTNDHKWIMDGQLIRGYSFLFVVNTVLGEAL